MQKGSEWRLLLKTVFKKQATGVIRSSFFLSFRQLPRKAFPAELPPLSPEKSLLSTPSLLSGAGPALPALKRKLRGWRGGGGGREVERVDTAPLAAALGRGGLRRAPRLFPRTLGKKYCAWLFGRRWEPTYFLLALKMTATFTVCVIQRCSYVLTSVTTANQFQVAM